MTQENDLNAPWTLRVGRDGTEDVGTIYDSNGHELVHSHPFWLPDGDDPVPPTLAALRLMTVAPKLLAAAKATLTAFELILEMDGPESLTQATLEGEPLATLRAAILEAEVAGGAA